VFYNKAILSPQSKEVGKIMKKKKFIEIKIEEVTKRNVYLTCPTCGKEGQSIEILSSIKKEGQEDCGNGNFVDWGERYQVVKCNGCETVFFRRTQWNSEDVDYYYGANGETVMTYNVTETLFPEAKVERRLIRDFYLLPERLQNIYNETALAINSNQPIHTGVGIRAILETICKDKQAEGNNLDSKINSLLEMGVLSKNGAGLLHKLRILGNASAHEVKPHSNLQLELALEVLDNLLLNVYILEHHSKTAFP
jgi:transcription elongation factor Elf1